MHIHIPPIIASPIFFAGIVYLFWLDRDPDVEVSKALWIPTIWLLINCSRPVSFWLGITRTADMASAYAEGSPVDATVFLVLVAAALFVLFNQGGRIEPILRENWPIVLFFGYAAFSMVWSDDPFVTFKHWIKGIGDVMMVLIVLTEARPVDAMKRLLTRVGFLLVPLSVLTCKYYPGIARVLSRSWEMEYTGVTGQKNGLGELCLFFGLGLLWRFRSVYNDRENPDRRRRLLALGTVLVMVIWLLRMCQSLTSICALGMAGAVMLLFVRPAFRFRPVLVHALVVALIGISAFALFFQQSGGLVQALGRTSSLSGRTTIWAAVLSVPVNRVVGAGYESFWLGHRLEEVQDVSGQPTNEAHDGYLEMYVNLGWTGLMVLALLIVTGYRNIIGAWRRDPDIGSLRLAFLLGALITAFTEAAFRMLSITWIFFLIATIGSSEAWEGDAAAQTADQFVEYPRQVGDADNDDRAFEPPVASGRPGW